MAIVFPYYVRVEHIWMEQSSTVVNINEDTLWKGGRIRKEEKDYINKLLGD